MKARFMTKTALSALALAFAGALPGVAQQTASPAAVPAVNKVKASAVEKAFMNQMAGVVQASLKAGALDMKAVTEILNAAACHRATWTWLRLSTCWGWCAATFTGS